MARSQFADSVSETIPQLAQVAARYDGYTNALLGYIGVLDRVQPRLLWLGKQLAAGIAEKDATARQAAVRPGAAGWLTPGAETAAAGVELERDRQLRVWAAEFDRLWWEWDQALRRCKHALGEAGRISADRHGWSALSHSAMHILSSVTDPVLRLAEHPDLASLSHALGSLATDLTVLGAVLVVVFPPAAGVCFTAAAVMSAAKLGTDAIRAGRGDPGVGLKTLGADAVAALPGGKAAEAGEDGARAVTTLENLAEHERGTTLVPGGGMGAHEAVNGNPEMGHSLLKHVGLSRQKLEERLRIDPGVHRSSAFYDRDIAENSISSIINENHDEISAWLAGNRRGLALTGKFLDPVGISIRRGGAPVHVSGVRVVLRRNYPVWGGYRIHTAFPQP